MKATIAVLVLTMAGALAQEFIAPSAPRRQVVPQQAPELRPTIDGIVKQIFVDKKPWQMVNPVAPVTYGTGQRYVSRDFGPGTPVHSTTVTVAGVEW